VAGCWRAGAPQSAPRLLVLKADAAGGAVVASGRITAMATTPVATACPIRLVCFRLAAKHSTQPRRLFLDGGGQIWADPHWLPREQALLLAHNQQLIWGSAARALLL
jgi:hypothetical protein